MIFNRVCNIFDLMKKLFVLTIIAVLAAGGCIKTDDAATLSEYSETKNLIGTFITVTVYAEDDESASKAFNASFTVMGKLGSELSHYSESNRVYDLNTGGFTQPVELTPDLASVIKSSSYFSKVSDGAFDVTVQPLVLLWAKMKDTNTAPSAEEVGETQRLVDYRKLEFNSTHAWFTQEGMSVTFGGIAKGYIVDKGLDELRKQGMRHGLINAGGDIAVYGGKPAGVLWSIALRNPRNDSDYITLIEIADGAVATSGDYERYYTEDKSVHHIIDPRTGHSATSLTSATILAESATQADALATAIFVLGPEDGLKLAESLTGVEAILITENKTILKTNRINS